MKINIKMISDIIQNKEEYTSELLMVSPDGYILNCEICNDSMVFSEVSRELVENKMLNMLCEKILDLRHKDFIPALVIAKHIDDVISSYGDKIVKEVEFYETITNKIVEEFTNAPDTDKLIYTYEELLGFVGLMSCSQGSYGRLGNYLKSLDEDELEEWKDITNRQMIKNNIRDDIGVCLFLEGN